MCSNMGLPIFKRLQADDVLEDGNTHLPLTTKEECHQADDVLEECRQADDVLEDGNAHYPLTPSENAAKQMMCSKMELAIVH